MHGRLPASRRARKAMTQQNPSSWPFIYLRFYSNLSTQSDFGSIRTKWTAASHGLYNWDDETCEVLNEAYEKAHDRILLSKMTDTPLFQKYPLTSTVKFNACFTKREKAPFTGFHLPRFLENNDAICNSEKMTDWTRHKCCDLCIFTDLIRG
jgi:hypothetical protein